MNTINVSVASRLATSNIFKLSATALIAFSSFTFSTSLSAKPVHSHAQANHALAKVATQSHKKQAENQTLALANLMSDYRHAAKSDKQDIKHELIALANERRAALTELVKTDPAAAVRAVLPTSARAGMPDEIKAMLTEKRELKGKLEVSYVDYDDPSQHRFRHTLVTDTGRVELHLPANAKATGLSTGARVQAKGWLFNEQRELGENPGDLVLHDEQDSLVLLADGAATTTSATGTLSNTQGEQRTLVLLLNFQDRAGIQPWTHEQVQQMVFGTVNDFYKENSNDQAWLTGDVRGYYTLPINATCDAFSMDSYAQQVAADNGIDLNNYDRLVYLYPEVSGCGWTGQGTVGGSPSRAWINGSLSLRTVGHELGHNFGLHHAKDLDCGTDIIDGRCISFEYGDALDIMGKSGITGHFNAFSKQQLGWLTSEAGTIVTADSDGSYQLEPYETAPNGEAKGIRVRRGTDAETGEPQWYYLEYRQAIGFDSFVDGMSGIKDGVVVHLATDKDMHSNLMLDMTPESGLYDLDDAALSAGASYQDVDAGVTITTEWTDSSGASVSVSYSGGSCVNAAPSLSLTPNESAWVAAGASVTYTATVTNNDSAECAGSRFDISAAVPNGWVTTNESLELAPGASGSVTLNVTSATTAADGFYDITISAENSANSNYHSSGVVSYVVEAPVAACVQGSPKFTLSVADSGELVPGTTAIYQGTLVNQDSSSCEAVDFDISAVVPAGWSAETASVNLAPGAMADILLNVTSAAAANDGVYDFNISAQNRADSSYRSAAVAHYTVAAPQPVCTAAAPLITVSNKQGGEVAAGTQVTYSATVTNRDSADCAETDFDVFADVPAGWSASSSNVSLKPGASAVVNINVTSSVTATAGDYNIAINAQNVVETGYQGTDIVSYSVKSPAVNTAPVAVNDNFTMSAEEPVVISVLGNDWDPENDTLTITAVTQGAKGSVQVTSSGQLLYTPAKSFKSSDSFSYTISDGDKTDTAIVAVSLSSSDGGSGGKGHGKNK